MEAQSNAHPVHIINTHQKFISQVETKYQAGIIATSEGKGIKRLDSIAIIIKIPTYHKLHTIQTIKSIITCSILIKIIF